MKLREIILYIKKSFSEGTRRPLIPKRYGEDKQLLTYLGLSVLVFLFVVTGFLSLTAPSQFPVNTKIIIEEGSDVRSITTMLDERKVVRSRLLLQTILAIQHPFTFIKAGTYIFTEPRNVFSVAQAITEGTDGAPLLRVTIPEGLRGRDLEVIFHEVNLKNKLGLSAEDFDEEIGYLYPDTYFVPEDYSVEDMLALMRDTYEQKVGILRGEFEKQNMTEDEVITLASIIEREASTSESKHIVAGILRTRLDIGMALQVDASFSYLFDKESSELTLDDLKVDSPYNTYLYPGLPPTPIANPGLEAVEAVLYPEKTEYLYYLTAPDGTFYYAETFAEHKRNKERYLR